VIERESNVEFVKFRIYIHMCAHYYIYILSISEEFVQTNCYKQFSTIFFDKRILYHEAEKILFLLSFLDFSEALKEKQGQKDFQKIIARFKI